MKYFNIKRNKFSTIFKNINFKRYERILANVAEFVIFIIECVFSGIYKSFNFIRYHFLKTYNNISVYDELANKTFEMSFPKLQLKYFLDLSKMVKYCNTIIILVDQIIF